jgi:endonuclease/exonuclease/phosphatase family metal-dependent hydrolase
MKKKSFSVATFNVLFNKRKQKDYIPHIVCSEERYKYQMNLFQKLDCDILCLNEVTSEYLQILKTDHWIKKNYEMTDISGKEFGNLILSKFPIKKTKYEKITMISRKAIICEIELEDDEKESVCVNVCCVHLKAENHHYETRKKQLEQIYSLCEDYETTIILGDLNLAYDFEGEYINHDFVDVWKNLKKDDPGFTFDSVKNLMHDEMWPLFPFSRQMRLDRILLNSKSIIPQDISIFANTPIHEITERSIDYLYYVKWPFRSISSQVLDIFSVNLWRDPKDYLFPSDHFGLISNFGIKK